MYLLVWKGRIFLKNICYIFLGIEVKFSVATGLNIYVFATYIVTLRILTGTKYKNKF